MANIYDLTDTWNNGSTAFDAIKMDVTDTNSAAGANLLHLLTNGTSRAKITKAGAVQSAATSGLAPAFSFTHETNTGMGSTGAGQNLNFYLRGTMPLSLSGNIIGPNAARYGFAASAPNNPVTTLIHDASGVVGLRGATDTSAAAFSFYTHGASPPSAPGASIARLYADTSGGKIRLMALFPSGAAQQIAIEP